MPRCASFTRDGVTDTVWGCLKSRAKGVGVVISGDEGSASAQGVTLAYRRDAEAQTLAITVAELPVGADCAMAAARIRAAAASCGAA
jgi:hypothetical protein